MNTIRFLAIAAIALSSIVTNAAAPMPPRREVKAAMAVTRVVWSPSGNGLNRCVSFSDAGPLIYGEGVWVKHWLAPGRFPTGDQRIAPTRNYRWRINNGVLYLRWERSSLETPYLLHPYGTTTDCAYAIQIALNGVNVTVDSLPGGFKLGSKIPVLPVSGQITGGLSFTGAADVDPSDPRKLLTGVWFRPIKVLNLIP